VLLAKIVANSSIETLHITDIYIGDKTEDLGNALANSSLTTLIMHRNGLGNNAVAFGNALNGLPSLTTLNMFCDSIPKISTNNLLDLATALVQLESLTTLSIDFLQDVPSFYPIDQIKHITLCESLLNNFPPFGAFNPYSVLPSFGAYDHRGNAFLTELAKSKTLDTFGNGSEWPQKLFYQAREQYKLKLINE